MNPFGWTVPVTVNNRGIPYFIANAATVTDTSVNIGLGFRRIPRIGEFVVAITSAIPEGTTGTLPIQLTLNGVSLPLTQFGGGAVTAADLAGTGVIEVWYDFFRGILQIVSPIVPTA